MKFFKFTAVLLAAVLTLSLTACTDRSAGSSLPETSGSVPNTTSQPDISAVPAPSESGSTSSSKAALNADFSKIGAQDGKRYDWGPGGPKDEKGRPVSAATYNEKFGKYNTIFMAEDKPTVYLTFDEGYENGFTGKFLDVLKEKNVKGLFFLTGGYVESSPELVKRMVDEGHVLGNHSWKHPIMPDIDSEKAAEDITKLHRYMEENYNVNMKFFRFPAGAFNEQNLELVNQFGYKTLFWSFAYKDWLVNEQPDPQQSLKKILDSAHPGAIYLLHTVSKTNAQIIGQVIDGLIEKGYTIGDPNELAA